VFLTSTQGAVPHALLHNLAHNKVLHERVIFSRWSSRTCPGCRPGTLHIKDLANNCFQLTVDFGFKDRPDVMPGTRAIAAEHELGIFALQTSFFLSRET